MNSRDAPAEGGCAKPNVDFEALPQASSEPRPIVQNGVLERYGNHAPLPGIHTKLLPLRGFVDLFDSLGFETYLDLMRLVET